MSRIGRWRALAAAAAYLATAGVAAAHADGQRDFDFNRGAWKTHVSRLERPLSSSPSRQLEYDGMSVVSDVWNGRASIIELDVQGPAGRIQGIGLRLYNPQSRQWNLNWVNGGDALPGPPMIGEFRNGRGEFFDHELFAGRSILARNAFFDITAQSTRFEQAFSADGGRTWEPNWLMTFERTQAPAVSSSKRASADSPGGFDFHVGTWAVRISRLQNPLTGSTTWHQLDGKVVVRSFLGGHGNLAEVTAHGQSEDIELLSLRLYDPQTHQWRMYFARSADGTLGTPMIGEFKGERGEFYSVEPYRDRTIMVRFVFIPLTADSARSEQAFSQDGGKTWEVNWINNYTRSR